MPFGSNTSPPPPECWAGTMLGVYYDHLPHWVVDYGCYSFTFHCRGSLPADALARLKAIAASLQSVPPRSDAAVRFYRTSFKTLEAYLDTDAPTAPFALQATRQNLDKLLASPDLELNPVHWVIMPNHLHLITRPLRFENVHQFKESVRRFKMRTTHCVKQATGRKGRLWQRGAYDRWIRSEREYRRWQDYLNNNPVKAGLVDNADTWTGLR